MKNYNTQLQVRVGDYIKSNGVSQSKLAASIGVSQTALSQWRNSKYDNGNIEEIESKIYEFFKLADECKVETSFNFIDSQSYISTSISEEIYKLIRYCHLEKGMVVIHGDAGIGKTKGAEKYVNENPNSTIYIQATPSSGTLSNILKLLAKALKIPVSHSKMDLISEIREKLDISNKVIIIDEAQHLKYSALEEIRTLSEPNIVTKTKGTGIVLIGNTETYHRMLGKQEARFAQQFSRIKMNKHYTTSDIQKEDISLIFSELASFNQEISFLLGVSQSKWGIRGAVNVYNNAVNNKDITYNGLFSMARAMGIGILN